MKSILITGCNRGLGLGLVKHLVKNANCPEKLIVTCRSLEKATELQEIADRNRNVHVLRLDVKNTGTFDQFAKEVEGILGDDGLNVLFNNAGYSPKSTRINFVKADQLGESFATNVIGPIMLIKALLPALKKASSANSNLGLGPKRAAVVNMSSILGSISANSDGGLYPYRCSKAALNMATKSLSVDLKGDGILVTCIHPGWVKTDMGGNNAPLTVDASCSALIKLIYGLNEQHNGGFYQWDGRSLQW